MLDELVYFLSCRAKVCIDEHTSFIHTAENCKWIGISDQVVDTYRLGYSAKYAQLSVW